MKSSGINTINSLLISTVIIAFWVTMNFLLFYPATNGMGDFFSVAIMFIITEYTMLIAGVAILLLRLFKVVKSGSNFLVVFAMETNILIGIFSVFLYLMHKSDLIWLNRSLLNLLIGVLLFADFLLFKRPKAIS